MINSSNLLRRALIADGIISGAMALLLVMAAAQLASLFALPQAFVLETGLLLIPYALLVGYLGLRERLPVAVAYTVIGGNALWTVASIVLLLSPWLSPNLLGEVFVVAQAVAVGVIAELQYAGLRKSGPVLVAA